MDLVPPFACKEKETNVKSINSSNERIWFLQNVTHYGHSTALHEREGEKISKNDSSVQRNLVSVEQSKYTCM